MSRSIKRVPFFRFDVFRSPRWDGTTKTERFARRMTRSAVLPIKTCLNPVDLSARGSSSTRQTISDEGFLLGAMRICASILFLMGHNEHRTH